MVRKSELGAGGQRFLFGFLVVIILLLGGVVFYLLSDLQQRKFQLRQVGNELQVERGRFLPFGSENKMLLTIRAAHQRHHQTAEKQGLEPYGLFVFNFGKFWRKVTGKEKKFTREIGKETRK